MRLQTFVKLAASLALCLVLAATASAQYGGGGGTGGTGPTGSGTPSYNYGKGKAIGIGVGAAAGAAVGIALWLHHRHKAKSEAVLIGCTQPSSNGISLKSEEEDKTYTLISGGKRLQAGERVEVKGVLKNGPNGADAFRVHNIITDFGACNSAAASKAAEAESTQLAATTK